MSKIIGVIPARFASTRFPGKPLALIAGKPLLQWVIEGAKQSQLIEKIIVATDDEKIFNLANKLDTEAIMTPSDLPSGTDRIWSATKNLNYEIAVNIQGDEPLITGKILDQLVESMAKKPDVEMATLAHKFKNTDDMQNLNTAKIVLNSKGEALYFSRFPIPYSRVKNKEGHSVNLQHIGIYGYRREFLKKFCGTPTTDLEIAEGLEQLRALYLGAKIQVVEVEYDTRGVDTPEDVLPVEKLLEKQRTKK